MFRGVWGPLIGAATLVTALVSGYWGGIAPQVALAPELLVGGVVVAISLLCVSLVFIIVTSTGNETWLAVFGVASVVLFLVMTPIYTSAFLTLTAVIEAPDGSSSIRTVRGYAYTAEVKTILYKEGVQLSDEELVRRLGSVRRVWTEESIFEHWRILLNLFATTATALVCALIFLASFLDSVLLDRHAAAAALEQIETDRQVRRRSKARKALRRAAAGAKIVAESPPPPRQRASGELPDPDDVLRRGVTRPASDRGGDGDPTSARDPGKRWLGGR